MTIILVREQAYGFLMSNLPTGTLTNPLHPPTAGWLSTRIPHSWENESPISHVFLHIWEVSESTRRVSEAWFPWGLHQCVFSSLDGKLPYLFIYLFMTASFNLADPMRSLHTERKKWGHFKHIWPHKHTHIMKALGFPVVCIFDGSTPTVQSMSKRGMALLMRRKPEAFGAYC